MLMCEAYRSAAAKEFRTVKSKETRSAEQKESQLGQSSHGRLGPLKVTTTVTQMEPMREFPWVLQ